MAIRCDCWDVRLSGLDPCDWHQYRGSRSIVPILTAVRRGILGGTFDPPHVAHLMAGEAAYRDLGLDVVTFLPAGAPWQKAGKNVSAPEHRWKMTQLAVADVEYFEADDREVRRDGWTYTVDTLATFPAEEELVLILGADAARGIRTWHQWEAVVDRAGIAVMHRPGIPDEDVEAALQPPVPWLDTPLVSISGTTLRAWARRGKSLRFLVRDRVWKYIEEHEVYAND